MKRVIILAAVAALSAAAPKPPSTYEELLRSARDAAGEGRRSVQLNGRSPGANPDPTPLRNRLLALCARDEEFWQVFRQDAVRNTDSVASVTPGGSRPSDRLYGTGGKLMIAQNFGDALPNQVRTLADTMPPAGRARFLRSGETLRDRPADFAAAIRQRAEWLVLVNAMTADLGAVRDQAPRAFQPAYVLGLWARVQCDLATDSALLERQLEVGYPTQADGADTESAFLLLLGASGNPELAERSLAFARARTPSVAPTAIEALARWARPG